MFPYWFSVWVIYLLLKVEFWSPVPILLSVSPFRSVHICFVYLGALMLGASFLNGYILFYCISFVYPVSWGWAVRLFSIWGSYEENFFDHFCGHLFWWLYILFFLGVKFLDWYKVGFCKDLSNCSPKLLHYFIPLQTIMKDPVVSHPHQCLVLSVFFILDSVLGMFWYPIMILVYITIMTIMLSWFFSLDGEIFSFFFYNIYFIEVTLIYNVVLICACVNLQCCVNLSAKWFSYTHAHIYSYIHIFFFIFSSWWFITEYWI